MWKINKPTHTQPMRTKRSPSNHSARVLQATFRKMQRKHETYRMLMCVLETGVEAMTKTASFTDLVAFIKQRPLVDGLKTFLDRLCFLSTSIHDAPIVQLRTHHTNSYTTRVFLAMYLVRYHPGKVFGLVGPRELALINITRSVVDEFDEIVSIIKSSKSFFRIPACLSHRFCTHLNEYYAAFANWEQADKAPVWARMRLVLVSLYLAFFAHPRDEPGVRSAVHEQILNLRQRALECSGQATLDGFDLELKAGKFGLPPLDTEQLRVLESDPKFFALGNLEQIQLVQELFLDVNYRVTSDILEETPMHVHVSMTRDNGSHWNEVLIELISSPSSYESVKTSFKEFKQRILKVVDEDRKRWVHESIDLENLTNGGGWVDCLTLLHSVRCVISRIQMPVRDKAINEGWEVFGIISTPEVLVQALKYTHQCLKTVELDYHSMRILLASHVMNQNGVAYISSKYQELLASGVLTMQRTKAWISLAVKDSIASGHVGMADLRPLSARGIGRVLYRGFEQLVFSSKDLLCNEHDFPETLLLDVWRLCSLQRKIRIDASAVCTLTTLHSLLTPGDNLTLKRVAQLFLSLKYGKRVSCWSVWCAQNHKAEPSFHRGWTTVWTALLPLIS
jgi:hypothetical protein